MMYSSIRFAAAAGLVLGLMVAGGCGKESTVATGSGGPTEPGTLPSGSSGATDPTTSSTDATTTIKDSGPQEPLDPNTPVSSDGSGLDQVTTVPAADVSEPSAGSASPGSSGVDGNGVVSTVVDEPPMATIPEPGYDQGTDIVANPSAKNPHATALMSMEPAGDSVRVTWWGGVCDQLVSATAEETTDAIMIDVRTGFDPAADVCTDQAVLTRTVIQLAAPVGSRKLVDVNANG